MGEARILPVDSNEDDREDSVKEYLAQHLAELKRLQTRITKLVAAALPPKF